MKRYLFILLYFSISITAFAQRYRVDSFDIRPGLDNARPVYMIELNNKLVFEASNNLIYNALFETDGNSMPTLVNNPDKINGAGGGVVFNNKLYYPGETNATGEELYIYDGVNPPKLEVDIVPGATGSLPHSLASFNNKLYLSTNINGKPELVVYDPATTNVSYITNKSAHSYTGTYGIRNLTPVGNLLYFIGNTAATGNELFVYDPTSDTITISGDIYPGTKGSNPGELTAYKGVIYFSATDDIHGCELWKCDGKNAPVRLTDLIPGKDGGMRDYPIAYPGLTICGYGDRVFFRGRTSTSGSYYLCAYDIAEDTAGVFQRIINPDKFLNYGTKLFFNANALSSYTLYQFDGTDTAKVVTFANGYQLSGVAEDGVVFNNALFLCLHSSVIGAELFKFTDSSVSVQDVESSLANITAYPNPVTQDAHINITLKSAENISVQLTDINGRTVYHQPQKIYSSGNHTLHLPMQALPAGMYVYKLTGGDGRMLNSGKLLKQ